MNSTKFIDIEKILKEKVYKLYKWLPFFAVNWLKKILHEDDINKTMFFLEGEEGLMFNSKGLDKIGAKVDSLNSHFIPKVGPLTVVSNHPLGGLDGMALIKAVGDVRPDVRFFVNDVLKKIYNYGDIFVAVNKIGSISTKSLRVMEQVFRSGNAVLIFPAGLVSRKKNGLVKDLEWRKTFITQAIDHKRLIQPTYIEGENSNFFYNFAKWRKRFGIKANIEMILLPKEMFRSDKKTIKIHFSKPFSYKILDETKSHKEWSVKVYEFIYSKEFMMGVSFEEYIQLKKQ